MKKIFIIAIIIILMAVAAGASYFLTAKFFQNRQKCATGDSNQREGVQNLAAEIRFIGGTVEKVEKDVVFVHFAPQGVDKVYQVKVGSGTKLVKLDFNDSNSVPASGKDAPDLPKISLNDIKKDDFVVAQASEDIKDKTEFIAKIVTLQIPVGAKKTEE